MVIDGTPVATQGNDESRPVSTSGQLRSHKPRDARLRFLCWMGRTMARSALRQGHSREISLRVESKEAGEISPASA